MVFIKKHNETPLSLWQGREGRCQWESTCQSTIIYISSAWQGKAKTWHTYSPPIYKVLYQWKQSLATNSFLYVYWRKQFIDMWIVSQCGQVKCNRWTDISSHQDSFENHILHCHRPLLLPNSWSLQHLLWDAVISNNFMHEETLMQAGCPTLDKAT